MPEGICSRHWWFDRLNENKTLKDLWESYKTASDAKKAEVVEFDNIAIINHGGKFEGNNNMAEEQREEAIFEVLNSYQAGENISSGYHDYQNLGEEDELPNFIFQNQGQKSEDIALNEL